MKNCSKQRSPRASIHLIAVLAVLTVFLLVGDVSAQWASNANNIHNTNSGNVGIGTTTPAAKLAINGSGVNVYNTDVWTENNIHVQGNETLTQGGRGRLRVGTAWGYMGLYTDTSSTGAANDLLLASGSSNVRVGPGITAQNLLVPNGNVGIGTTAPGGLLDLATATQINNRVLLSGQEFFAAGNSSTSGVALRLGTNRTGERQLWFADSAQAINATNAQLRMRFFSNSASLDALTTDGTDVRPLILQSVGGNVGIGATGPTYKFQVSGSGGTLGDSVLVTDSNNVTTAVDIANTSSGAKKWRLQSVGSSVSGRVGNFELVQIESNLKALVVQPGGNVGVGTTAPSTKLHVDGDVTVTGNIAAKYQDVAEWVPARQAMVAGTIVALDTENSNQVVASTQAYDTRVAGVISAQPGLTLGEAGKGKVLVSTTGRVKVRVDATRNPIRIGDLLVTSDKEGMAMKSEPVLVGGRQMHAPGTLIGKALEPLPSGTGEILVLLSLQ